jgi:hypothetical protein
MNECHHSFSCYFAGSETPVWRTELTNGGCQHVSLSFYSALARMPKTKPWLLEDKFDEKCELLVDAGSFSTSKRTIMDPQAYHEKYIGWLEANIDRLSLVLEYCPQHFSLDTIKEWRQWWEGSVPREKFVAVWHEEHGMDELEHVCERYQHVAIKKPSSRLVEGRLRSLITAHGVKLHGSGISTPDDMVKLPYHSIHSMMWLTPTKSVSVNIWAQNRLQIYVGNSVDNALKRHEQDIINAGFDPSVFDTQHRELLRYTIWAWRQYEADLQERRERTGGGVISAIKGGADISSYGDTESISEEKRNLPVVRGEPKIFPGMEIRSKKAQVEEGKEVTFVPVPVLQESSLRKCSSCYLSGRCPEYSPGADCAFHFPVEIDTPEALMSSMTSVIGTQFARVMFARAGEEADGSLIDPAVSEEMDRYLNMVKTIKEIQSDTSFLEIKVKGNQPGILAQIMSNVMGTRGQEEAQKIRPRLDVNKVEQFIGDVIDIEDN